MERIFDGPNFTRDSLNACECSCMVGAIPIMGELIFWLGESIEFGKTKKIFTNPSKELTESYITGRMG